MIIKRKHTAQYAIVPNSTADDENLAADALGVLTYLLAKPDDWEVNVANLRKRFGLGKHRVYGILSELVEAGYVRRSQRRNPESRFVEVEYFVFDTPQTSDRIREEEARNMAKTPLPENQEAVALLVVANDTGPIDASTASRFSASRKSGRPISNKITNPPSEGLAPPEVAFEGNGKLVQAPPPKPASLNAQVWTEAKAILQPREYGCVTNWLQRVREKPKGIETLLAIIQTARRQGTGQPVPYITAALAKEFPPPPDPKMIDRERWQLLAQAAINLKTWDADFGPRPGEPGCLVPADLITPQLLTAVANRRAA